MHDSSRHWDPRQVEHAHGGVVVFKDKDGIWRFEHHCHVPDSDPEFDIISAPTLEKHDVSVDGRTVSPSILCSRCQTHGFFTDGVWRAV